MNRGSYDMLADLIERFVASMRPRFMNRGSLNTILARLLNPSGFNEAPIHESGKSIGQGLDEKSGPAASMRPRFMNRGSAF